jgi:tRNA pseudouridine55 synthase
MIGFLNINKSPGPTSHDIVDRVRRVVGRGVKVGHAGTLDPFACGVLVVCAGGATRLASYVQDMRKRYRAVVELGATSSTDDATGAVMPRPDARLVSAQQVQDALGRFVGTIMQTPPAHSAVHVNGRRAYKLARAGQKPAIEPRAVEVHAIELLRLEYPLAELDILCGSGTYIRAIARDLGEALGTGAYCRELTRTEVGPFVLDQAVTTENLSVQRDLVPPQQALAHMPSVTLAPDAATRFAMGNGVWLPRGASAGEALVLDEAGELVGVGLVQAPGNALVPKIVLSG